MKNFPTKYWNLIAEQLSGNISNAGEQELSDWINQSEENKKAYEQAKTFWSLPAENADAFAPDSEQAWIRFQKNIQSEPDETEKLNVRWFSPFSPLVKAVAVFVLFLGIIYLMKSFYSSSFVAEPKQIVQQSDSKNSREIYLPDSSRVILNHNSTISYSENFNKDNRIVNLMGEAFFEVRKAEGKPFTIIAGESRTQVLGTSFNVKMNEENKKVEVIVVTGKVSFMSKKDAQKNNVILLPGDMAELNPTPNKITKTSNANVNSIAWKTKTLVFSNSLMSEVIPTLENYFAIKIVSKNKEILNYRFTGTFENPKIDELLSVFEVSMNIASRKENNHYILNTKSDD